MDHIISLILIPKKNIKIYQTFDLHLFSSMLTQPPRCGTSSVPLGQEHTDVSHSPGQDRVFSKSVILLSSNSFLFSSASFLFSSFSRFSWSLKISSSISLMSQPLTFLSYKKFLQVFFQYINSRNFPEQKDHHKC